MSQPKDKRCLMVERLYKKTIARSLSWSLDSQDDSVDVVISGKIVSLRRSNNSNGEPIEIVTIYKDGNPIESFSDEDLGFAPDDLPLPTYWQLMVALHDTASRQALGADDAIDEILDELDDDVPF
jgi:hypothetical protein